MTRVPPLPSQRDRLLEANAHHCCVCKRSNVGFHLHHIDEDHSNTIDSNLAVLCVEDHDRHHRPTKYQARANHTELGGDEIRRSKTSWEAFVGEARRPAPTVIATLSAYGSADLVHSLQLVMQWPDERIECTRSYHLLDGDLDQLTDRLFKELSSIGKNIKLVLVDQPLPIDHCPCCGKGFTRTTKPAIVIRLTDPGWATESFCNIYVNPDQPSLAALIFLRDDILVRSTLHLCQGKFLHFHNDWLDDRIPVKPKPSVRTQASRIVSHLLTEWDPAIVRIGTGNPDDPELITNLFLPGCWEVRRPYSHTKEEGAKKKRLRNRWSPYDLPYVWSHRMRSSR